MKYTPKNGRNVRVFDAMGKPIPHMKSFNTKTCRAVIYVTSEFGYVVKRTKKGNSILTASVLIPGAYAEKI